MKQFTFIKTSLQDVYLIAPFVFEDARGYFLEAYNKRAFDEANIHAEFVQENVSKSKKGVLRGLHFQSGYPQGKLIRIIEGRVFDVAVDLRKGSPTFGSWEGFLLSDYDKRMLYIPEGFAHGFLVLSEAVIFQYKCTDFYRPEHDNGIIWNDPTLKIEWPLNDVKDVILSDKDKVLKKFDETICPFLYKEVQ